MSIYFVRNGLTNSAFKLANRFSTSQNKRNKRENDSANETVAKGLTYFANVSAELLLSVGGNLVM